MNIKRIALVAATAAVIHGCVSTPENNPRFDQLQTRLDRLLQSPETSELAPVETQNAIASVARAREAMQAGKSGQVVEHHYYLTEKQLDVLEQTLRLKHADQVVANAELARKQLLLKAKTREAEDAQDLAREMHSEATAAHNYAYQLQAEVQQLNAKVQDLQARESDRGLILTLGNILFELDAAQLKPDARETLQEIALFLNKYPDRAVRVEGFTDSTGDSDYNQQLSLERASSVEQGLIANGVDAQRISVRGYGELHPVAANDSAANRQENRRVEIVLANDDNAVIAERR